MKIIILIVSFTMSLFAYTADCEVYPSEMMNDSKPWTFSITVDHSTLYLHKNDGSMKSEPYKQQYDTELWKKGDSLYANESSDYIEITLGKMTNDKFSFSRIYTNSDVDVGTCQPRNASDYYEYGIEYAESSYDAHRDNGLKALRKSCDLGYQKACDKITSYKYVSLILWLMYFSFYSTGAYLIYRIYKTYKDKERGRRKAIVFEVLGALIVIGFLLGWYDKAIWRYYYADTNDMLLITLAILFLPLWHYIIRSIVIKLYTYLSDKIKLGFGKAKKSIKETEQLVKRGTTADELLKWLELKEKGVITEEEFEKKKQELLK